MFVERLSDIQIQQFRILTDLHDENGKPVNYCIYCNNKFYPDPKGSSNYAIFLTDFNCVLTYADKKIKSKLKQHYIKFMRNIFKEEYDEQLTNINDFEI